MKRRLLPALLLLVLALVAPVVAAAQQTTIILARHAEKLNGDGDLSLSEAGRTRAARLADVLRHSGISAVFSTPLLRTRETAQPAATVLGVEVTLTPIGNVNAYATALAAQILRDFKGKTVLVVGHSNTTPDVIRALGAPAVPPIADDEYDNLYVVQINAPGEARLIRAKY